MTSLQDKGDNLKDYFPKGIKTPLLALYADSAYLNPANASFDSEGKLLSLTYENGSVAKIKIEPKASYFRMELESVEPRNNVEAV